MCGFAGYHVGGMRRVALLQVLNERILAGATRVVHPLCVFPLTASSSQATPRKSRRPECGPSAPPASFPACCKRCAVDSHAVRNSFFLTTELCPCISTGGFSRDFHLFHKVPVEGVLDVPSFSHIIFPRFDMCVPLRVRLCTTAAVTSPMPTCRASASTPSLCRASLRLLWRAAWPHL